MRTVFTVAYEHPVEMVWPPFRAMVFIGTWALGLGIWKGEVRNEQSFGSGPPPALKGAGNGRV